MLLLPEIYMLDPPEVGFVIHATLRHKCSDLRDIDVDTPVDIWALPGAQVGSDTKQGSQCYVLG